MTAAELPTTRLRQLRDGHDPDDAVAGRARAQRIARLQQQIVDCDELAAQLGLYRQAIPPVVAGVKPAVARLVDRQIRHMIDRATTHRTRLEHELRALQ